MGSGYGSGGKKSGGSAYAKGVSVGGSAYGRAPSAKTSSGGGHGGVVGLLENLGGDVKDALLGLPAGLVETVRNPIGTAKAVGASYAQTYGPLAHGDVSKFLHELYEHPLGPILDVATILTGGAGAAAKGGQIAARAGIVSQSSRLARLGRTDLIELRSPGALAGDAAAQTVAKPTSRNPVRRAEQQALDRFLKQFPARTPFVGEIARFGRELDRLPRQDAARLRLRLKPYQKAYAKLETHEQVALGLLGRAVSPEEWKQYLLKEKGDGARVNEDTLRILDRADVRQAFASPSPALLDAAAKARAVAADAEEILVSRGRLSRQAAHERRYLHRRLISGGRFLPEHEIDALPAPEGQDSLFGGEVGRPAADPGELAAGVLVSPSDRRNVGRVVSWDPETRVARVKFLNRAEGTQATATFKADELTVLTAEEAGTGRLTLKGGKSADELQAEITAARGVEPFYLPDTSVAKPQFLGKGGGGLGVPRNPVHRTEAILFRTGQLALQPDVLGPEFLRVVKFALYEDIHDSLMASAVKVPKGNGLRGLEEAYGGKWVYVRRPVGKGRTPEKIGYTERTRGDFSESIAPLVPDEADGLDAHDLTTTAGGDAEEIGGYRLAIPKALADRVAGEFTKSSAALDLFLKRPTSVWRALVLNLRPAWLVNNLVGNHLLYAVKFAGPAGLRSYAHAVRDAGKETSAFRELVNEHFPEQVEGTFIDTQRPTGARKLQNVASAGLAPLDRGAEATLRRAGVEAALRKHPEVRAAYQDMPAQTRSFEAAAQRALDTNPHLAREVSQTVNAALGNYLDLSPFERGVLRTIAPFYAWYRAITLVTLKMALDTPGRANMLAKLGAIGSEQVNELLGDQIPDYLRGFIPFGPAGKDGRVQGLNTGPVNPFGTLPSLSNDLSGTVNPLAATAARALLGGSKFDPVSATGFGKNLSRGGADIGLALPQVRLFEALTGHLYQGTPQNPTLYERDRLSELLAYLGAPVKRLSPERARELGKGR